MRNLSLAIAASIALTSVVSGSGAPVAALSQEIEQFDVVAPPGSSDFGDDVTVLANGNYVVVDPEFSSTAVDVGAVHLYDGRTDQLISTLTGSTAGDEVGSDGIEELDDERFAVFSPDWGHPDGTAAVGAVTIVDATTGLDGIVTVTNSLHGSSAGDAVGDREEILGGGRLVVLSPEWDHPDGTVDVGAATLVDGAAPITGPVTLANSLHGTQAGDGVGQRAVALSTGDYVVGSDDWNHPDGTEDVGATTQADGTVGIIGPVTLANSLHGIQAGDAVGNRIVPLTNGNHVIASPAWNHPDGTSDVGAVTWVDGAAGLTGPVTVDNSLHGSSTDDHIGSNRFADEVGDVEALTNGNYVVQSLRWDAPDGTVNVGAVTWADGSTGITGPVTVDNSLHGTSAQDGIGVVTLPLTNGNYVTGSQFWNHPDGTLNVGAVTWGNGSTGITGPVTPANSLHGETANDDVGFAVEPLANGNYVVPSQDWDHPDGTADVGAATWGDGTIGIAGAVSPANSLHGTTAGDKVGDYFDTIALTNGNYVVAGVTWSDPAGAAGVGAATWADGTTGLVGPVTVDNSLHGTTAGDEVGESIDPLLDGNYVVRSRDWDHPDGTVDVGAATWGDGTGGTTGPVMVANSAHGSTAGDAVGRFGFQAFDDGSYAVTSEDWDDPDGPVVDAGAVLFGLPNGATTGPLTRQNSVVGTPPGEVDRAVAGITAGDSIVVETAQLRVLVMRLDRPPFFPVAAPDVAVATAPGADTAVVDYPTPVAADVRSDVDVVCAPASGSTFPVGTTEVTCTATDAGGQTATTAFDVVVTATPDDADVTAVTPERILDTRNGFDTADGLLQGVGRVVGGSEIEVQVAGRGGIPVDADAAFLNVTAVDPADVGFVTVHPCGVRPNASNVNYEAGDTAPNAVLAKLSPTGTVCIFTLASSDIVVDTAGFTTP